MKRLVSIPIYNESLERTEKMLAMGFQEETAMTMKNLDELLATLWQHKQKLIAVIISLAK